MEIFLILIRDKTNSTEYNSIQAKKIAEKHMKIALILVLKTNIINWLQAKKIAEKHMEIALTHWRERMGSNWQPSGALGWINKAGGGSEGQQSNSVVTGVFFFV